MSKKDYESAARIVQEITRIQNADDARVVKNAFVALFRNDSSRFDEKRFQHACVVGANVKARR